jgi:hypothetical protein
MRNAEDERIIETIVARTGLIPDKVSQVHVPWPAPTMATPALPSSPNADDDGDGYTNLEEWLHELTRR